MQKLMATIICFLLVWNLAAQPPKTEFTFQAKTSRVAVSRGGTNNLDLSIVRSKRYEESEMKLSVGSALPTGIEVSFQSPNDTAATALVTVVAKEAALPGTYNVVLNCTINNKTKGVIVKLVIPE
jgi:hypothetical protein